MKKKILFLTKSEALKNLVSKNSDYEFVFNAENNDFSLVILDQIVSDVEFFNSLNLPIISFAKEQKSLNQIHFLDKPVRIAELFDKIENLLKNQQRKILNLGDLVINFESRFLQKNLQEIKLTELETKILEFLLENSEEEKTKIKILQKVWLHHNATRITDTGIVETTMNKLRKKLKEINAENLISLKIS